MTIPISNYRDYMLMLFTSLFLVFLRIDYSESQRPFQDVAWLKPATQIGTYQNNVAAYGPQLATDGLTGDNDPYSFIDSGDVNIPAWWKVDLQSDCIIKAVGYQMSNREGRNRYLETLRATIETSNGSTVECGTYDSTGKNVTYLFMSCKNNGVPVTGRKVIFSRNGGYQPRYMAATEFFVHGIFLFGNQALEKPTNQSQFPYNDPALSSGKAVDKNFSSCSLASAALGEQAWWQVDLQMYISVTSVRVFVTDTNQYNTYFSDVEITVDYTNTVTSQNICTTYSRQLNDGPLNVTLPCNYEIAGRFVTFRRNSTSYQYNKLVLCDVQVIGRYIGELTSSGLPVTIPSTTRLLTSSTHSTTISTTSISTSTISTSRSTSTTSIYTTTSSLSSTTTPFRIVSSPTSTTSTFSTTSSSSSLASSTLSYSTTSSSTTATTSKSYTLSYSAQRINSELINSVTGNYSWETSSQQPEGKGLQTGFIILIAVLAAAAVISLIVAAFFIGRSKTCRKRGSLEDTAAAFNQNSNSEEESKPYYSKLKYVYNVPQPLPYDSLNQGTQLQGNTNDEPPEVMYRGGTGYVEIQPDDTIKSGAYLNQPVNRNSRETFRNLSRDTIYAQIGRNSTISSL